MGNVSTALIQTGLQERHRGFHVVVQMNRDAAPIFVCEL